MSDPVWMKWIDPGPKDEEENAQLEAEIFELVGLVKFGRNVPLDEDVWAMYERVKQAAEELHKAISAIPADHIPPQESQIQAWDRNTVNILWEVTGLQAQIGDLKPLKGRRYNFGKFAAIDSTFKYLKGIDRRRGLHKDGPVVGLAKWAWEAGGGDQTSESSWVKYAEEYVLSENQEIEPPSA